MPRRAFPCQDFFAKILDMADEANVISVVVKRRRAEMRVTQTEAAARAGISLATWNLLEGGRQEKFRPFTLRKASVGLGWPDDTLERIADGEDPDEVLAGVGTVHQGHVNFRGSTTMSAEGTVMPTIPDGVAFASELPDWEQWSVEEKQGVLDAVQLVMRGAAERHRRSN